MPLTERVQRWMASAWGVHRDSADSESPAAPPDLAHIRQAMHLALAPCSLMHRARAAGELERANTVLELWLMRSNLYQYLAQDMGEAEATRRISALLPLFKDAIPGSVRPFGDNGVHGQSIH